MTKLPIPVAFATLLCGQLAMGANRQDAGSANDLFKANCIVCHGQDGRGTTVGKSLQAADLHSRQVQSQSDAQLGQVITQGKGNMPPFGTRLSSDQVNSLIKYVRVLGKAK